MANPAPILYYISPNRVPAAGGPNMVQVVGRDIDRSTAVITLGGNTPTLNQSWSRFLYQVNTPAHAAGAVDVKVTTTDGTFTLTGALTYV